MSRSYKKHPVCGITKTLTRVKAAYNRKLRRKHILDVPSGNYYRKMNNSWLIKDGTCWGGSYQRHRIDMMGLSAMWGEEFDEDECRDRYRRRFVRK